jgi:hypothetical protein
MLAGVAIAVLATGCKGNIHLTGSTPTETGSPSTATPAPSAPTAPSTEPTTTTPPSTPPTAAATPSSDGAPAACYSMGLHASLTGYDAGAGQRYVRLVLTNLTEHPCALSGWTALELMSSGNQALGANVTKTGAPEAITLPAGGHAHSRLHWTVVPANDETGNPCEPTPVMLQVTAPGETTPLFTTWAGGPVCQHLAITETPLTSGTGA